MNTPNTAPFRHYAESEGYDPEWLLAHARTHLANPPASIDDEIEYTLELNQMFLALGRRAISAIHLANFKAFGPKPQRFPLAPLTLLFGPNSAGKSSLLHALLYAQHSVAKDTLDARFPQGGGTLVDLGKFNDMVHNHDPDAAVQMGFEFAHLYRGPTEDSPRTIWWVVLRRAAVVSATLEMDGVEMLHFTPERPNSTQFLCVRANTAARFFQQLAEGNLLTGGVAKPWEEWDGEEREALARIFARCVPGMRLQFRGVLPSSLSFSYRPLYASDMMGQHIVNPSGELVVNDAPRMVEDSVIGPHLRICERALTRLVEKLFEHAEYFLRCLDYLAPVRLPPGRDFENLDANDVNHWHNGGSSWRRLAEFSTIRERLNRWFAELQPADGTDKAASRAARGIAYYQFEVENDLNQIEVEAAIERVAHNYLMERYEAHEKDRGRSDDDEANMRFYFPFDQIDASELARRVKEDLAGNKAAIVGQRLIIRDRYAPSNPKVSPPEIGVGIQYLIPVLVEAFGGGSPYHLIEEPELHAHPALQAELGDVFIEAALGEPRPERIRQFVIETHSEHLILRILRRIRQSTENDPAFPARLPRVRPQDVAVIFAKRTREGTELKQLAITPDGDFADSWPYGFFTERGVELFD